MSADVTMALRALQRPITRHLWTPDDAITFTPAVLDTTFGDGRALFRITTINNRPAYWIFRGCSSWEVGGDFDAPEGAPEIADHIDDILRAIEEEFGTTDYYEMNERGRWIDQETKRFVPRVCTEYPAINSETGCVWSRMDWPNLEGIALERHPFAHCTILTASSPTPKDHRDDR